VTVRRPLGHGLETAVEVIEKIANVKSDRSGERGQKIATAGGNRALKTLSETTYGEGSWRTHVC
jgi:hypothetical protein